MSVTVSYMTCAEYNKALGGLPGLLAVLQQRAESLLALAKTTLARAQVPCTHQEVMVRQTYNLDPDTI